MHASTRRLIAAGTGLSLLFVTTALSAQDSRRDEFYFLGELNKASAVMVVEQGIVPRPLGKTIADAVVQVLADGDKPGAKRSGNYLDVEPLLLKAGGPDVSRIHSGRSRQDIGATSRRLFQRDQVLATFAKINETRAALLDLAAKHPNAIVPAYTQSVQAQPISFGHYMLAYTEVFERNAERLRQAYAKVNQSPLGSAALGTSSFPVSRPRLAALMGFDGVIENSLDANQLSPIDTGVELIGVAAAFALTAGQFLSDVEAQYRMTTPWLLIAEGDLTGTSSIMPQKRNPSGLNNTRIRASEVLGTATSYLFVAHNVPHGVADYKGNEPRNALRALGRMMDDLRDLTGELRLNEKRALDEVNAEYSTTTELADVLQRDADVPFRIGHHFASELVTYGRINGLKASEIPFAEARRIYTESAKSFEIPNAQLPLTEAAFRTSLSAEGMVQASKGLGGPQPAEVSRMLQRQRAQLEVDRAWVTQSKGRLDQATAARQAAFEQLRSLQ